MVANNCHGKTKSHGTTNFTHVKTLLSDGKNAKQNLLMAEHNSRTQLFHGKTKLTRGKTQKKKSIPASLDGSLSLD